MEVNSTTWQITPHMSLRGWDIPPRWLATFSTIRVSFWIFHSPIHYRTTEYRNLHKGRYALFFKSKKYTVNSMFSFPHLLLPSMWNTINGCSQTATEEAILGIFLCQSFRPLEQSCRGSRPLANCAHLARGLKPPWGHSKWAIWPGSMCGILKVNDETLVQVPASQQMIMYSLSQPHLSQTYFSDQDIHSLASTNFQKIITWKCSWKCTPSYINSVLKLCSRKISLIKITFLALLLLFHSLLT